ncbi:MAG: ATP-binding cassette domain-containing protein [Actinomycetota bacterium]
MHTTPTTDWLDGPAGPDWLDGPAGPAHLGQPDADIPAPTLNAAPAADASPAIGATATAGPGVTRPGPSVTGSRLALDGIGVAADDGQRILDDVSLSVGPGELVAIVGASGSGKSTMLQVLAGNLPPSTGRATIDGLPAAELDAARRRDVGFVPQEEVLHDELPLGRMLTYAARLRVSAGRGAGDRADEAAARALDQVELGAVVDVPVRRLSGGQRRRASLAIELVTSPRACLLDEPTSGLDPATAETILGELRQLADRGRTVVFVTHNADDLRLCDRIVAVGPGGRLVFDGTPSEAIEVAASNDTARVHRVLISATAPLRTLPGIRPGLGGDTASEASADTSAIDRPAVDGHEPSGWQDPTDADRLAPSRLRQLATLTARTVELVVRNRLTAAIMAGSPAMVVAMFAILFQAGAFDPTAPSVSSAIMAVFWVAFGGFFFGLTYGLLQICPEAATMQRERRAGVPAGFQVLAKLLALTPILLAIDVAMLGVLVALDRLPSADLGTYAVVAVTLGLDAVAALSLGLLASALVRSPAQASLALPMLCFPAVLFSGAVLPVPVMAPVGRAISAVMPDRWAFEAIGADLGLRELLAGDEWGAGPALLTTFGSTWTIDTATVWLILAVFIVVLTVATWVTLAIRCQGPGRDLGRPARRLVSGA